jgi:hypothetical protein
MSAAGGHFKWGVSGGAGREIGLRALEIGSALSKLQFDCTMLVKTMIFARFLRKDHCGQERLRGDLIGEVIPAFIQKSSLDQSGVTGVTHIK